MGICVTKIDISRAMRRVTSRVVSGAEKEACQCSACPDDLLLLVYCQNRKREVEGGRLQSDDAPRGCFFAFSPCFWASLAHSCSASASAFAASASTFPASLAHLHHGGMSCALPVGVWILVKLSQHFCSIGTEGRGQSMKLTPSA